MATPKKSKTAKAPPPAKTLKKTTKSRPAPAKAAAPKKTTAGRAKPAPARAAKGKSDLKTPSAPKPAKPAPSKKKTAAQTAAGRGSQKAEERPQAALSPELLKAIREALVNQQRQILSAVQTTKAQMAEKVGDLPDVSDRASEGYINELAVGLLAIEAAQLDEIEAAIRRIDDGTYGLCIDCGKPIPAGRLEVLPFAQRCLACKGIRERGMPTRGGYTESRDEDEDRD